MYIVSVNKVPFPNMSLNSETQQGKVPVNLINANAIKPGYEASAITEFGENKRFVIKEVDPLEFHLPVEIRKKASSISDLTERATYIAEYKKLQYEKLKKIFREQMIGTDYIVFKSGENIRVGIIQSKVEGQTITQLAMNGEMAEGIIHALQKFFDLLIKAQSDPDVGQSEVVSGYVPKATEILKEHFEPPSSMPDFCNLNNLIYDQNQNMVIAVDW